MERTALLKRNITNNYGFYFLACLRPSNGVWMIYLAANGLSLLQLGALEGIFHIASFLGEVPTGAIADLKGRLASRKLGRIFYVLATLLVMSAYNYTVIVIGFILYSISYNLESGAGEALIYDTLLELDKADEFKAVNGNLEFFYQSANIIGLLVGGALALLSYYLLYTLEALMALGALAIAYRMIEPQIETPRSDDLDTMSVTEKTLSSLRLQLQAAIRTIRERPIVSLLILHSSVSLTVLLTLFYYLQVYWKARGLNEFDIGVIFSLGCVAAACSALLAPAAERNVSRETLLKIMPLGLIIALIMLSLEMSMPFAYVLASSIEGILIVVIQDWLNSHIPSSERATILSFQSMCFSSCMILTFPLVGYLSQNYSMAVAFATVTVFLTGLTTGFFVWLGRVSKHPLTT